MNIKEYISTGILEAYCLGELSEQERIDVEKNLALHPELMGELRKIEQSVEKFLMQTAIEPRKEVKDKIFEKIANRSDKQIELPAMAKQESSWRKYAMAASIVFALVSSYLAIDYRSRWKKAEISLNDLIAQNQSVAENYNTVNQRLDKIEKDLKVYENPDFVRVLLKGTSSAPEAQAAVYWNENSKEVYLSIQNMRQLAQENQYQLWAIIDGKPVDAGVFDSDGNGTSLLRMKDIGRGAVTFAVTIEPRGGQPSPTLQTMQVAGNVSKG